MLYMHASMCKPLACVAVPMCGTVHVLIRTQVEQEILQRHLRWLERSIARPARLRRSAGQRVLRSWRAEPDDVRALLQGAGGRQRGLSYSSLQGGPEMHAPEAYTSSSLSWSDSEDASHTGSVGHGAPRGPSSSAVAGSGLPHSFGLSLQDAAAPAVVLRHHDPTIKMIS